MSHHVNAHKALATTIKISAHNNAIDVYPEWVVLSYCRRDNIKWEGDNLIFDISFPADKTPFSKARFTKDDPESGDIQFRPGDNAEPKIFKYTVTVNGVGKLDPGVIIIP